MTAAKVDLTIEQGATFVRRFQFLRRMDGGSVTIDGQQYEPQDLTGATVRAQVRRRPGSPLLQELTCTITDAAAGRYEIQMTDEETDAITYRGGAYDCEIELADGTVTRVVEGEVTVIPQVTVDAP